MRIAGIHLGVGIDTQHFLRAALDEREELKAEPVDDLIRFEWNSDKVATAFSAGADGYRTLAHWRKHAEVRRRREMARADRRDFFGSSKSELPDAGRDGLRWLGGIQARGRGADSGRWPRR